MCSSAHGWVYDWQTLIAGFLALLAGIGTVVGTLIAARRQVNAVKDATNSQLAAAKQQTAAAQHQTELMRDMEERRRASEAFAFYAILEAAMGNVISDVKAARQIHIPNTADSLEGYQSRTSIKRMGFAQLRTGLLRFGGHELAGPFLQIDGEIEKFASQFYAHTSPHRVIEYYGVNAGISDHLDRIEEQATALRGEAERGMEITRERLCSDPK